MAVVGDLEGGTMSGPSTRASRRAHPSGDRLTLYRRPHLLIAHGEPLVREGLAGIFNRASYDVDEAGDVDEALAILDKGKVDALVVSYRLPPDGCMALLDACEALPPTVVLNGLAEDVSEVAARPSVCSVLTRPFRLHTLYDVVAKATGGSGDRPQGTSDG